MSSTLLQTRIRNVWWKRLWVLGLIWGSSFISLFAATIGNLRCEHLANPLGMDVTRPNLSWLILSTERGDRQTAYRVLVASSPTLLAQDQGNLWDSGTVTSDQSTFVTYAGQALTSGEECYWKVQIWDQSGASSGWSSTAMWSMGLLSPTDWTAHWIGMATDTNILPAAPSPMLRKTFVVSKPVARATAYICGLGYYELQINGEKIGDQVLDPTWTRYDFHAVYDTYDVTTNLQIGTNVLGVQLANGFYNQWATDAWNTASAPWRALPQLIMQMDIQYTDGTSNRVLSDTSWKAATGPLLLDATRLGEVYDARLEKPGWTTTNYDDATWTNAILREGIAGSLIAPDAEPVKMFQLISPVNIIPVTGQSGEYTFDFGQNLAGWARLNVTGPAGTSVKMVFSEKTNSDGSVNQSNINVYITTQKQYFQADTYILKGGGPETYEPRFTYHGFRYVQVIGLPSAPTTNTLLARVVHTAFDPAGSFSCSSDLLNRLETATIWSYIDNFVGIPTDCPHREKNGWTGDAQLACEMGLTHFHSEAAYTRWLKEFDSAQLANGKMSGVMPNAIWGYNQDDGPAWESAILLIPWFIYQHCGDIGVLTNHYATMKAYVDYETSVAANNIVSYGLADWEPAKTKTPASITDTAYYYQDALILAQTAAFMGNTAASVQYSNLAAQIKISFNAAFYDTNTCKYAGGTQTAQSCALYQNLVGTNQISAAANVLNASVQQNGDLIDTGNLGSKYLLRALCDNGYNDTAIAVSLQTNYPSWGNMIMNGATTLWETWSGTGAHDSLNHIMFGDISGWFIEYLAGIRPGTPGYKTVLIKPEITGAITWAQGTHDSPFGMISNAWRLDGQCITMDTVIPPNTTAMVYLPTLGTLLTNLNIQESGLDICRNGQPTGSDQGVAFDHWEGNPPQTYAVWRVASGDYEFVWNVLPAPSGLTALAGNHWISLTWNAVPSATGYRVKRAATFGGPYELLTNLVVLPAFTDMSATNGQNWYYVVSAVSTNGESTDSSEVQAEATGILNSGFEIPRIATYQYNPSMASWLFSGTNGSKSGISANSSGFTSKNPNAPEGTQVAFVQSNGIISQTISGFSVGTNYTITFSAAQRNGPSQHGGQSWDICMDGHVIASFSPPANATNYVDYSANLTATSTTHTLSFVGTDRLGGDNTIFIDNVRLSPFVQPVWHRYP